MFPIILILIVWVSLSSGRVPALPALSHMSQKLSFSQEDNFLCSASRCDWARPAANIFEKDSDNYLNCGLRAYTEHRVYFSMINGSCYIPIAESSISKINKPLMIYQRVLEGVTLFRVVNGSGINSYQYFITTDKAQNVAVENVKNNSANFRSSLLDEWNNIRPRFMKVMMRDENDRIVTWLLFAVNDNDDVNSWFSQKNLNNSFPWKVDLLLKQNYNFFSIIGDRGFGFSFFMNFFYGSCEAATGVICVNDNGHVCPFHKYWIPQFLYAEKNEDGTNWNDYAKFAKSFELVGVYDSLVGIYY